MHSTQLSSGFRPFSWALALFCLPSALFPLAWLISPQFSSMPNLSDAQIHFLSITFWSYPIVLLASALFLHKIHQKQPRIAQIGLTFAFISFYALFGHIVCLLA